MAGAICVNEFFLKKGWLALKEPPAMPRPLKTKDIDWSKTRCWGEGGYYSRIFMNVKGREPQGTIEPSDYEKVRGEIKEALESIGDESGNPIGTKVFRPEDVYREVRNVPPDLIVYFGDLAWRSAGTVGTGHLHIFENESSVRPSTELAEA